MRRLVVALAAVALAVPAVALAGGWATVQLSSTPTGMRAETPWVVDLTVLQHGITPLAGVRPEVRIAQGSLARSFVARPTPQKGVYRARVVFPRAGTWRWTVWDGFTRTHTYAPVKIARAAV
jgi:hypothetical protein